jgi:hypothetical protein
VLRNLGEREAARKAYEEALTIYWPLVNQLPQAFLQSFAVVLRNYVGVSDDTGKRPVVGDLEGTPGKPVAQSIQRYRVCYRTGHALTPIF